MPLATDRQSCWWRVERNYFVRKPLKNAPILEDLNTRINSSNMSTAQLTFQPMALRLSHKVQLFHPRQHLMSKKKGAGAGGRGGGVGVEEVLPVKNLNKNNKKGFAPFITGA